MTKDFSFLFLFSFFLALTPCSLEAETIGDYEFSLNSSAHTATLLKPAVALTGDVTLPPTVSHNGITYTVTAIDGGTGAGHYHDFFYGQQLTSLTVPEGYLSIGDYAFSDCAQLASVALPNSLQSVGNGAFYACTSLSSVTLSEATTVVYGAFGRCPKRRMVKIRCADVPTSAEQKTWNDNTDNRVLFLVPAFAWSVSVANNTVVDAGGQLRFAQNTNGLEVKYTATVGGVAGSEQRGTIYTFPSATTAPQTVNIVAEAVGGTNIVVEGGTTLTLQYTLRGQVPFTLDLGGGVKAPEASLTLPAKTTDYNVPVTYKVGTQRKTGTYKFPKATTEAQSITIVAQATAPANCTISGESSKSFEFLVKGERSYAWEPSYADGQDVPAGYEMQLPATVSDQGLLNVAYTMNGQAVTGTTFPFPTAQASKQEFDLVATPSLPDDLQNVALTNPAAKTYHYTVRGRAPFVPNLLSQDIAPEKNLTLDATTDNGLNVTYTVNGTTTEGSFKMPKASTDPQTFTIVATATAPNDKVDIEGEAIRSFTYRVRGQRSIPEGILPQAGPLAGETVITLPTSTDNGLTLTYQVDGTPLSGGTYKAPSADANYHAHTITVTGAAPEGVDVLPPSVSYKYTVLGQRRYTDGLRASGPVDPGYELDLPKTANDDWLTVGHTVNGEPYTGNKFKFPTQSTAAQRFTIVAQAALRSDKTDKFELVGETSKRFEYVVQGLAPFAQELEKATGLTLAAPYKLPLPGSTDNGLTVGYTIDGQPYTGANTRYRHPSRARVT